MEIRLTFNCFRCSRHYSLFKTFRGYPKIAVQCPFCMEEGIVDLDDYRDKRVEVLKGDSVGSGVGADYLILPKVLQTSAREK